MAQRQFTGRHAAILFVSAFAVIITVNLVLAYSAVKTFPGLEVKNSYVASQEFDDRRAAQSELGWTVDARHAGGLLVLSITDEQGRPVEVTSLEAILGRPTHIKDDSHPAFQFDGTAYVAPVELSDGNWNIRMKAVAADGTEFMQRVVLHVKG
ncbi:FixH family protein [uncultured Shimia sp.]|uniref:FixH family protein n=1 Tax=uncultured Shimia sp. TaxID=573152 RepID=UPI0026354DF0|nr:FixH family protein [uncultured Shimia sp.]